MQLSKIKRQSNDKQKLLTRMKQVQSNNLKSMQTMKMKGINDEMQQSIFAIQNDASLSDAEKNSSLMTLNTQFTTKQQTVAMEFANQQAMMDNAMTEFEEAQTEPLKNMEEMLTTEKLGIESQLRLLEEQEKAAGEMKKSSVKDFTPEYTGS